MINLDNEDWIENYLTDDIKHLIELSKASEESFDEDWIALFIILRMAHIQDYEDEALLSEFKSEILHNNRFFPQSNVLNRIKDTAVSAAIVLEPGVQLFRCREYSQDKVFTDSFVRKCMEYVKSELSDLPLEDSDFQKESVLSLILPSLLMRPGIEETIKELLKDALSTHDSYWGYAAKDSDSPPNDKTKSMRVNPEGISYLYSAENVKTAIMEMRPLNGQYFSVATIEITDRVKLFDFTIKQTVGEKDNKPISMTVLDKMFSQSNYGNALDYIPMQFICEYIKQLGFDGIRYNSSLLQDGKNIVLFNTKENEKKYKITGSEVYSVNSLDIDFTRVLSPSMDSFNDMLLQGDKIIGRNE